MTLEDCACIAGTIGTTPPGTKSPHPTPPYSLIAQPHQSNMKGYSNAGAIK